MLLMTLGPDAAAEVLQARPGGAEADHEDGLDDGSRAIGPKAVLIEVNETSARGSMIRSDDDQLREMLTKALGDDRANQLLSRMMSGSTPPASKA